MGFEIQFGISGLSQICLVVRRHDGRFPNEEHMSFVVWYGLAVNEDDVRLCPEQPDR